MKKDVAYQSLGNALHDLRVVEDELYRPQEDAVTLCSCNYTRNALNGFLRAYLLENNLPVNPDLNSDELLSMCSKLDAQFNNINLSPFICRNMLCETGDSEKLYCLSVEKVNECFKTTRVVKDLVLSKLHMSELDFA